MNSNFFVLAEEELNREKSTGTNPSPRPLQEAKNNIIPINLSNELAKEENSLDFFDQAEQELKDQPIQKLETPQENDIELEREIERNQARLTSRALETIAGAPGDIYSFGKFLFGFEPDTLLPTSESLKNKSEKLTQGYTKARNKSEELADELIQDVASFALPGSQQYSLMRNIGIPLVGNLLKQGVNYFGGEDSSSVAKLGTMFVLDLMSQRKGLGGSTKKYAGSLFEKAKTQIPKEASTDATQLKSSLDELKTHFKKGGSRTSTKKPLKKINEIEKKIENGKIDIHELYEFRPSINELIDDLGGFDIKLHPKTKQKTINNLNDVKDKIIQTLTQYGEKQNPQFLKPYQAANEAYSVYENSNKVSKFIQKHLGVTLKHGGLKTLLGLGGAGLSHIAGPISATAGGLIAAGYPIFKIGYRIWKSPVLKEYYQNILTGALKGNALQVSRNAKKLDQKLSEQDNEE